MKESEEQTGSQGKGEDKLTNSSIAGAVEVKSTQALCIPFPLTCLLARTHFSLLSNCRIPWLLLHPWVHIWPEPACRMVSWLSGPMGDQCSQALRDKKAGKYVVGRLPTSVPTEDDQYVHSWWAWNSPQGSSGQSVSTLQCGRVVIHRHWVYLHSTLVPHVHMDVHLASHNSQRSPEWACLFTFFLDLFFPPPQRRNVCIFSFPLLVFQLRVLTWLWGDIALTELENLLQGKEFHTWYYNRG